ncbi:MAG: hypothetical protein WBF43_02945 [Methylocella sp.]
MMARVTHAGAHFCADGIKGFARYRVAAAICDPAWHIRGAYRKIMNDSNRCLLGAARIGKGLSPMEVDALDGESMPEVVRQTQTAGRGEQFCAAIGAELDGIESEQRQH